MRRLLLPLTLLLSLCSTPAWAATPTHDASSNSGSKLNASSTAGYSHTAGTLTNGIAIIRVASQDSTGTISGVTYNGAAATQCPAASPTTYNTNAAVSLWYYLGPPSGSSAVVATFSEAMNFHTVIVSTYSNTNQASPIGTCAAATNFDTVNPSEGRVTITSAVGELVVGVCAMGSAVAAATAGSGETDRGNVLETTNSAVVGLESTGAATVDIGCTLAESRANVALGVSLKPSADSSRRGSAPLIFQ